MGSQVERCWLVDDTGFRSSMREEWRRLADLEIDYPLVVFDPPREQKLSLAIGQ
jgi:hypothetical protein